MCDGQLGRVPPDGLEPTSGGAMQLQLRGAAPPYHLDVAPQHAVRMPRAERLHGRFLGSKAPSEMNRRVAAAHTVRHLGLGENTAGKSFAVALDRGGNARDVCCVEPDSDDVHASQA